MNSPPAHLYLWVVAGSGAGALVRHLVTVWDTASGAFPWSTLGVNAFGSLLIGLYFAITGPGGRWRVSEAQRVGIMAGFCAGMTTFSVFSLENLAMWMDGEYLLEAIYISVSLAVWLGAVWAGYAWGMCINRLPGPGRVSE